MPCKLAKFIYSNGFLVDSLGFSVYKIISSANTVLFLQTSFLGGSISFFTIRYDVSCGFFVDGLYQVEELPFYF